MPEWLEVNVKVDNCVNCSAGVIAAANKVARAMNDLAASHHGNVALAQGGAMMSARRRR